MEQMEITQTGRNLSAMSDVELLERDREIIARIAEIKARQQANS